MELRSVMMTAFVAFPIFRKLRTEAAWARNVCLIRSDETADEIFVAASIVARKLVPAGVCA